MSQKDRPLRSRWPSRLKRAVGNLALLAFSLTLALVAAEVVLRFLYTPPLLNRRVSDFDPQIGWKLLPGAYAISGKESESRSGHTLYINTWSMRHPEISARPARGTVRVLLLGDSFTFGMFVPGEDLMAAVAQRTLAGNGHPEVEVVNAGAQGYGTASQLLYARWLESRGFHTDVFVLAFFLNDILDNLRLSYDTLEKQPMSPEFALGADGRPRLIHRPEAPAQWIPPDETEPAKVSAEPTVEELRWPWNRPLLPVFLRNRAIGFLETRSTLVHLLHRWGIEAELPRLPSFVQAWYEPTIVAQGWPLTQGLLRELRREVEARGQRFVIMAIPSPFQVYESYDILIRNNFGDDPLARAYLDQPDRPQQWMREFCAGEGVPFLDLLESFDAQGSGTSLYSPKDHHLSTRGHAVAGQALGRFLETQLAP